MSKINNQDNDYICLNSLISLNLISKQNLNNKYSKYLVRIENSDDLLAYKICEKPLVEYIDIIESIFYIRDIEECESIYGLKDNKKENNEISRKELRFIKKDRINQTTQFYLQHMISGKFITTTIILDNNKITLKLVNDIENAYPFSLKKINESRSSTELLTYNQIFHLNIYIKEEKQYYYLYEGELIPEEIDNSKKYFQIIFCKKALSKFNLINQTLMINNKNYIYPGQLINIIFSCNLYGKDEKFMLGVEEKKEELIDLANNNQDKSQEINNYKVIPYLFSENLYEHVLKKTFWVIEINNQRCLQSMDKEPIKIEERFRIKNPLNGLYLNIKRKNNYKISNNINVNKSFLNDNERIEYEFYLVDNKSLNDNLFFDNNFKFIYYITNDDNKYIIDDGKYILKSICRNFNKDYVFQNQTKDDVFFYSQMDLYYLPISLSFNITNIPIMNSNNGIKKNSFLNELLSKNELIIKNDDDFIFNIKKIDISKGNEVIFIQKIILKLEEDLKNNKININVLNDWSTFLIEYLINLEYSFKDNNYETNVPIKERQILLWKFNVINIIYNILKYFLNNIDNKENNTQIHFKMEKLLSNITRFLLYLSKEQEKIKIAIYIFLLNDIIEFEEILVGGNFSKLLFFIFELINDSEILQIYLLGDNTYLKKYIENDSFLSKMNININNLVKINKIFDFVEADENFLVWYQKLINLNKIQYKKDDIINKISLHIEQVKFKEQNDINPNRDNYIKIMKNSINDAKNIIKHNVILLDKFINTENLRGIKTRKTKFRNSLIARKLDFPSLLNKNKSFKKDKPFSSVFREKEISSKISLLESRISEKDEETSKNPTIKSTQPLINSDADDYIKGSLLSNMVSKDSERQTLMNPKSQSFGQRRNSERKNFRLSMRAQSKGLIKSFSNYCSIQMLNQKKNEKEQVEDNDKGKRHTKQEYSNILNKLGKIWHFLKWYETFDFNYALFIINNYLRLIFNNKVKDDFIEKQLFYFLNGNIKSLPFIKDLKINTDSKTGILYLFRLYNTLFPNPHCKYEDKINKNENISAMDILEDMKEKIETDINYEEIDEEQYSKILSDDSKKLDEYLCSFYSSYQFYINQYVKTVNRLYYILSNYFLNSDEFGDLKSIRECFKNTLKILLSKVIFIEDNILVFLYSKVKLKPSLLWGELDLTEIKDKSIQILSNYRKANKNYEAMSFLLKEKKLIDYLFLMCEECDKIKYMYEKITIFKHIKNLFFNKNTLSRTEEEQNNKVKKQIREILELLLTKKRLRILQLYEKFNNRYIGELTSEEKAKIGFVNNNYSFGDKTDSWSNYFYEVFRVGQITNFVTESLKFYEIKNFFNNIIYVGNNGNIILHNDKIIKRIRKIIDQFTDVENDILKLKINSISEDSKNIQFTFNNKESSEKLFENLYRHIAQIRNDSLECFEEIKDSSSINPLIKILMRENRTFYEKIHYIDKLKYMIKALDYYKNNKDRNILGYISNVLRILSKVKSIYPNFNKIVQENFEVFSALINKSFQCITQYPIISKDLNVESVFLQIFYYAIESFLYIIRNCKIDFLDIKDFMENTFELMLNSIDQFKTKKNKLISKILYVFTVCRLLLFLNADKNYDFYSYKSFFNKIFSVQEINKSFFNNTLIEENKMDGLIDSKNIIIEYEENSAELSDNIVKKKNEESFNLNHFPMEMQTYKMDSPKNNLINVSNNNSIKNENNINNKFNNIKEQDSKSTKSLNESLEWVDDKEMNRLKFYSSFLFVYCLYLNEKNCMLKDNDDFNDEKNNSDELSLNTLFKKLKSYIYYKNKDKYIFNNNNNNTNKSQDIKVSIFESYITDIAEIEEKSEIQNEGGIGDETNKDSEFLFIFSLFQAIVNLQHSSRNKNIEIPVKKKKQKDPEDNQSEKEEINEVESELFITEKKIDPIIFYYYESEYIDIILLEKIINEMYLKTNLRNYCLELCDEEDYIIPDILRQFFKSQEYYKIISNYYKNEFKLINSLYVQNNMSVLINKLFKTFDQEDFSEIESMKYFLYKKMGEIYSHEENKIEDEEEEQKNLNLIDYLNLYKDKCSSDFTQINLLTFFDSLIYIYPKYEKNLCLLYYKIGFEILSSKSSLINNKKKEEDDLQEQMNFELIIKEIIFLFNRKSNRDLIEDKYVFNSMLLSMRELYRAINQNGAFVLKHFELIKEFLSSLDFILGHLSNDFDKIVNFMKRPENLDNSNKFKKKKKKLEIALDFFISLMNFKKNFEEIILTEEIMKFAKEIIERAVKLLFLLIEINSNKSIEIMNILLDYLFEFIKGPNIENLNMVFSLGYLNLVSFVITNIDYYKLFLTYLKKDNMYEIIDNFSIIECKIIKIFIAYYNVSYSPYSKMEEFEKLQHWYEDNFKYIKMKLKKIFYISEKEMEKRQYDINKMLLFIKEDNEEEYSLDEKCKRAGILRTNDDDNIDENEKLNKKENKVIRKNNTFCIIKFDLLLSYYTLFNYYKDLSDIVEKNALTNIKKKKKNAFYWVIIFFIDFGLFLINLIIVLIFFMYFFFKRFSIKKKEDVDLLQDLSDIEVKCASYSEKKIIGFLRNYIREVEVSIKNVIYKVYFPMIDKSNTLLDFRKEYLKVDEIDSSDFTNYLLSNYDYINIRAKQYALINKYIDEFPIFNYIFKNMYIYAVLLIIFGLVSNFLIIVSFSTFVDERNSECKNNFKYASNKHSSVQCPHLFYDSKSNSKKIASILKCIEIIELILQGLIFIDYLIRKLAVEFEIVKLNYEINDLKNKSKKAIIKLKKCTYISYIAFPTLYRCFFNFQTIYYSISLFTLVLGIAIHPFFNCIVLLEFVNRIQLMQTILKAMYKPAKNILITLLMFILLEYFFSFFAVSWYTTHFPNKTDTSNFLKTFMRMMDQTFKQDGGIGTYLDKSLDDNYVAYTVPAYFNSRLFFDLLFFIIILLLIFQMFLSTIIDYFNETRENSETFEDTLETKCIVCGIDREKIEKITNNDKNAFDKHITYYHNIFNYIYYLMYLQSLSLRDVIIDNSVWELHLAKNLSYLPKNNWFKQLEKKCWKKFNQNKTEEEN